MLGKGLGEPSRGKHPGGQVLVDDVHGPVDVRLVRRLREDLGCKAEEHADFQGRSVEVAHGNKQAHRAMHRCGVLKVAHSVLHDCAQELRALANLLADGLGQEELGKYGQDCSPCFDVWPKVRNVPLFGCELSEEDGFQEAGRRGHSFSMYRTVRVSRARTSTAAM